VEQYLVNVDPNWGINGVFRHQYSALKVTEMWSGATINKDFFAMYRNDAASSKNSLKESYFAALPFGLDTLEEQFECVMYLRPDLQLSSKLPIHAFAKVCGGRQGKHIAVPVGQHNGLSDMFAFGQPHAMLLYGLRGLLLHRSVQFKSTIHAEGFLSRYLCHNRCAIHVVPMYLHGVGEKGNIEEQRRRYYAMLRLWAQWQSNSTAAGGFACLPPSVWGEHTGEIVF
jgi:hypothetical protein